MLNQKPPTELIFIDIETTSQYPSFADIPNAKLKELFLKKFAKEINETIVFTNAEADAELKLPAVEQIYNKKAPLYAEFGKVIAISIGMLNADYKLQTLNLSNADEKTLLNEFKTKCTKICTPTKLSEIKRTIVAYNGLIFDVPFLAKRFILNGMDIPVALDISGKKSWDINWIIDPKDHWKMGTWDGANNVSLDLLCACFNIGSSKDTMDGSMVKDVYWKEKDLEKISKYCEQDIYALAQVYLKMQNNLNTIKF